MFAVTEGAYINISGGYLHVNASGDGLDSNGDLVISGGEIYVSGPTSNGNGTLDYNGTATITGGTLIGAGSSGMEQTFTSAEQGVILTKASNGTAGSIISLTDEDGNELVSGLQIKNIRRHYQHSGYQRGLYLYRDRKRNCNRDYHVQPHLRIC